MAANLETYKSYYAWLLFHYNLFKHLYLCVLKSYEIFVLIMYFPNLKSYAKFEIIWFQILVKNEIICIWFQISGIWFQILLMWFHFLPYDFRIFFELENHKNLIFQLMLLHNWCVMSKLDTIVSKKSCVTEIEPVITIKHCF